MDNKRWPQTREEMPLSAVSGDVTTTTTTTTSHVVIPGMMINNGNTNQQIIPITSCNLPPSYHNINPPVGHPSVLNNDRGAPPSYEEAIDPNGKI